ncbi:MAG TPA: hypothetical protein VGG30_13020, partial [Pirellulales bacterium]
MQSSILRTGNSFLLALAALLAWAMPARAEDRSIALADGKLQLTAPETWQSKKPANRVIDYE